MIKILQNVGWKTWAIVASVLVVGWILYSTIQYIQQVEKDKTTIEILEETQKKVNKVEKDISKPSRDTPNIDRDGILLKWKSR